MTINYFLKRVVYFLVFIIAASPLIVSETFSPFVLGKAIWFRSIMWMLALIGGFIFIKNSRFSPEKNIGFLLLGVLIIIQIFSSIFGLNTINSFWGSMTRMNGVIQSASFLIFSVILFSIFRTMKEWINILRIIVCVGLLVSILGFLESFNIHFPNFLNIPFSIKTLDQPFEGISSTLGNPVYVSWYLVMISMLCLTLIVYEYSPEKNIQKNLNNKFSFLYISTILFSFYSLIINFSRGSIISISIGLIFFLSVTLYMTKNKRNKLVLSFIILLILCSPTILFLSPKIENDGENKKYEIVLKRIPEVKDYEMVIDGVYYSDYLGRGGKVQLERLGLSYDDYNDKDLEKKILNGEISNEDLCTENVLFQKWIMNIESVFQECTSLYILIDKIPGEFSKSILHSFHFGERPLTIKASINSWINNPIIGIGPENFSINYYKIFEFDNYLESRTLMDDPHNSLLKILSELGIAGLIMATLSYSYIFYISIKKIIKSENKFFWILISTLLITYFINSLLQFSSFSNQLVMSFLIAFIIRSSIGFKKRELFDDEINIDQSKIIYTSIVSIILVISIYSSFLIYASSSKMVDSTYTIDEYQKNVNIFPSLSTEPRTEMIEIINNNFQEFKIDLDYLVKIVDEEYELSLIYHPDYYPSLYQFGIFYYEVSKYKKGYHQRLKEIVEKTNIIAPDIQPSLDLRIRESIISGDNNKFKEFYFEWKEKIAREEIDVISVRGKHYFRDRGEDFFDTYYESIK